MINMLLGNVTLISMCDVAINMHMNCRLNLKHLSLVSAEL